MARDDCKVGVIFWNGCSFLNIIFYFLFLADLYRSNLKEWQQLESIAYVFDCFHSRIREEMYKERSKSSLPKNGIFFYDHFYYISRGKEVYGQLKLLPIPYFDSIDWLLLSQRTSEAYRCKLVAKAQRCMEPSVVDAIPKQTTNLPMSRLIATLSIVLLQNGNSV